MKLKNKYGFTLIELLAVIVVLAIIALIATPIVMNTIKKSQKGAAERSADNYIDAVETTVATKRLDNVILEGEYKASNTTTLKENYNFRVPFDIKLDEKYDLTNVVVDINDFYYEIKDNNTLSIYIELKLDNLEEKEIKVENVETDRCIEEEPTVMNNTGYLTYKIYIVKENDTIESIISKYSVSKELLDSYNDLSDIKLGDKIIIPTNVKSS